MNYWRISAEVAMKPLCCRATNATDTGVIGFYEPAIIMAVVKTLKTRG